MEDNTQNTEQPMVVLGFKSILDLVKVFPNEQTCIDYLDFIRWNGNVISPFDPKSKVYKCAGNKYRCKNTGKYFNVKTGTIFEDTKIPLKKWFMALYIFSSHKKGISSHQLAKDIDVTQKTGWFMLHRLRLAFDHPTYKTKLSGSVEMDETYMGGKDKNRHTHRKSPEGKWSKGKAPVIGMIERGGNLIAQQVPSANVPWIHSLISENIEKQSTILTDQNNLYNYLWREYKHFTVHHEVRQYAKGNVHTNTIECFWSQMKRGVDGIYHWVSPKHLQGYVDEYSLRFNTRKICTSDRFNLLLGNVLGRLTYQQLIDKPCN